MPKITPYELSQASRNATLVINRDDSDALALMKIAEMVISQKNGQDTLELIVQQVEEYKRNILPGVREALSIVGATDDSDPSNIIIPYDDTPTEFTVQSEEEPSPETITIDTSDDESPIPLPPTEKVDPRITTLKEANEKVERLNNLLRKENFDLEKKLHQSVTECRETITANNQLRDDNAVLMDEIQSIATALGVDVLAEENYGQKVKALKDEIKQTAAELKELQGRNEELEAQLQKAEDDSESSATLSDLESEVSEDSSGDIEDDWGGLLKPVKTIYENLGLVFNQNRDILDHMRYLSAQTAKLAVKDLRNDYTMVRKELFGYIDEYWETKTTEEVKNKIIEMQELLAEYENEGKISGSDEDTASSSEDEDDNEDEAEDVISSYVEELEDMNATELDAKLIDMQQERRPNAVYLELLEGIIQRNRRRQSANLDKLIAQTKLRNLGMDDPKNLREAEKLRAQERKAKDNMQTIKYEFEHLVSQMKRRY